MAAGAASLGQGPDGARVKCFEDANLESGDWIESVAEPLVRGLISQLKAEYQLEFRRAMRAPTQPAATQLHPRRRAASDDAQSQPSLRQTSYDGGSAMSLSPTTRRDASVTWAEGDGQPSSPRSQRRNRRGAPGGTPNALWVVGDPTRAEDANQSEKGSHRRLSKTSWANSLPSHASNLTLTENDVHRLTEEIGKIVTDEEKHAEEKSRSAWQNMRKGNSSWSDMMGGVRAMAVPDVPEGTPWWRAVPHRVVMWPGFDMVMGIVIIMNAITIGLETSASTAGTRIPTFAVVSEYVFLVMYIIELAMRFNAMTVKGALKNGWVRLDALLVVVGIMNFGLSVASTGGTTAKTIAGNFSILKLMRLARLARTVRLVVQFRTLWLLCSGLMHAVIPMIWTCFILVTVIYVFAIAGMEIIGSDRDHTLAVDEFGSIGRSMLFLLQTILLDNAVLTWKPLVQDSPFLVIYFVAFFLIGPIALMNIVTAIMVESSMRTATEDIEAKKAWKASQRNEMVPKLYSLFGMLDVNDSGELDIEEFRTAPPDVKEQISRIIELELFEEVFHLLDSDGDGSVSIDEFVDGIIRSWQEGKPAELSLLVRQTRTIVNELKSQVQGALTYERRHKVEDLSLVQKSATVGSDI